MEYSKANPQTMKKKELEMHDIEMRKKVLDDVTHFLDDRESSRLQSKKPDLEVDFVEVHAPKGSTEGDPGFHEDHGTYTGNADTSSDRDTGVARGESPVKDMPDSAPDKQEEELEEDGSGLGDHEKADLEKVYSAMESGDEEDTEEPPRR